MTKWDLQQFIGVPKGLAELLRLFIECVCEAFGTFIIVFFGCGSVLSPALRLLLNAYRLKLKI